ncbi:MAG: SPFH domain-containing protein [Deltaproteobacteria bacterium]|nr:SPFH domain-containing protein [Deltaproteobacteria bacterium]
MGLAGFIRKQFIDVIDWTEEGDDVLAWRFPTADLEIQQGAALIVRDTQVAVFVDEGRIADRFEAGRYVLRTRNLPVLTNLRHWAKMFESPFKSEVYFFSTRRRVGQSFGTPQPLTVRDRELGAVQVRAFGVYSFRIVDAGLFHQQISGTRDVYRVADLEGQLRAMLVSALAAELGTGAVPFLDLAANQPALAAAVAARTSADCAPLGLAIADVRLESLTLPDELQKRLEERIGMTMVGGDLGRYTQFQTARSIPLAAASEGGAAGAGVGVGAGVAMGQAMAQTIGAAGAAGGAAPPSGAGGPSAPRAPQPGPAPAAAATTCPYCYTPLTQPGRFCSACGGELS